MPMLRTHSSLSQIVAADRRRQELEDAARERELRNARRRTQPAWRWFDGLRRAIGPATSAA